ncbi:hypothetical protein SCWH03_31070 [Streptomyces pacificus]|uniref:Uncharacterized protein n=1 Tax=Streptomyces pacificus TaxID=2705029 RepID=A0A6A0AY29_9ACTN|nr:hypothetical protein SCWH03_31070 [Streptomyces pacificus]
MTVARDRHQPVALHPCDGLADRGPALVEPLRDAGSHRDHAFFLQLEDGAEIHLRGVDQSGHMCPSKKSCRGPDPILTHAADNRAETAWNPY